MSNEEKILLVKLILEDLRGNWGWNVEERVNVVKDLCEQLEDYNSDFKILSESINQYIRSSEEDGDWDGRWFRREFPNGYESMNDLYSITETYLDKSDEFKIEAKCLTYPENRFKDYEELD